MLPDFTVPSLNIAPRRSLLVPLIQLLLATRLFGYVVIDKSGCGVTKACLFKPAGCDPNLDCTIGIIFHTSGPNKMMVQMVAQSLLPLPSLQYIAIGFSKDAHMGDDFVSECVLDPSATQSAFNDVEVYASYNHGKSNDRTYLNTSEHAILFGDVVGGVVDGRLTCQFTQQIMPQMNSKNGLLWNLNAPYYIIGATGSAQHDEVNTHDLTFGSHFYPVVSPRLVNPSLIGPIAQPLPPPHPDFDRRFKLNDPKTFSLNSTIGRGQSRPYASASFPTAASLQITTVFLVLVVALLTC